jgi:FMN phosphatase YigB (HAD superfamily)
VNRADANPNTVFLFDVDNTLLDNDRVAEDLKRYLTNKVGEASERRYWEIFEQLRTELGYADYLGALQRYRIDRPHDPKLLAVSHFLINYPFANRLFPESLDTVEYARRLGRTVILSDGDVVFQPLKVDRSGLYEAFEGQVLIYIHKELELEDVEAKYPAAHYVMVDDKVRILAAIKEQWGARVTTVFPRQGHYALDGALVAEYPKPGITLERIGDLQKYSLEQILAAAGK